MGSNANCENDPSPQTLEPLKHNRNIPYTMSASLLQYRSMVCFHCADNIITIIVLPLLAIFLYTWLFLRQRIYLSAAALCPMLLAVVQ